MLACQLTTKYLLFLFQVISQKKEPYSKKCRHPPQDFLYVEQWGKAYFLSYANQQLFKMVSRCFKIIIVNTYLVKIKDIINMASKIYYLYICLGNSRNDYLCTYLPTISITVKHH